MKAKRRKVLVILLAALLLVAMVVGCLLVIRFVRVNGEPIMSEAAVGIFALIGTLIGTLFVAFELKSSAEVNCCEMLINLNNYFHDSERLMRVYACLDNAYLWGKNTEEAWAGIEDADVQFFCTFFENLSLLVSHRIARIKDLDDLFGYRFFLFMNNPHVQEKYLLTTSSSFANLFMLYDKWIAYRDEINAKVETHPVVGKEYRFTDDYLKNKLYLVDNGVGKHLYTTLQAKGKQLYLRDVWFDELTQLMRLQDIVHESMADPEQYVPTSRSEWIESLHLDYVLGAYDQDKLVAVALIIDNRNSPRNLGQKFGVPFADCYTYDAVFVHPDYRGMGLQKAFGEIAKKQAAVDNVHSIWCTVSPNNVFSHNNMTAMGYTVYKHNIDMYGGHLRDVMRCDL